MLGAPADRHETNAINQYDTPSTRPTSRKRRRESAMRESQRDDAAPALRFPTVIMSTASSSLSSPSSSVVRNRIALLEAQRRTKAAVAAGASATSPRSSVGGSSTAAWSKSKTTMSPVIRAKLSSADNNDPQNTSQDSTRLSTTAAASRNRRSRLLQQGTSSSPVGSIDNRKKYISNSSSASHQQQQQQRSLETRRLLGLGNVPPPEASPSSYATSVNSNLGPPQGPAVSLFSHHSQRLQQQQAEREKQQQAIAVSAGPVTTTRIGKIQRLRHMRAGNATAKDDFQDSSKAHEDMENPPPLRNINNDQPGAIPAVDPHRVTRQEMPERTTTSSSAAWRQQYAPATPLPQKSPQRHADEEEEEEKCSKSYANRIVVAPSSSSDYDSSRSHQQHVMQQGYNNHQQGHDEYLHQQQHQNDAHQMLPQDPSLSTSQMTPDVAAFFEGRSSTTTTTTATHRNNPNNNQQSHQHQHHPLYFNSSNNTQLTTTTNVYSPKDHDDDTFDYSGQDDRDNRMYQNAHDDDNDDDPFDSRHNRQAHHHQHHHHSQQRRSLAATFDSTTPTMTPTTQLRSSNTLDDDDDEDYHDHDDYGYGNNGNNHHHRSSNTNNNNSNNMSCYNMNSSAGAAAGRVFQNDHDTISQADDDDNSVSFSRRTRQEQEAHLRREAASKAKADMASSAAQNKKGLFVDTVNSNDSFVGSARKHLDTPAIQTACGVAAAATAGCFLLGPVGLLVGAAAVGIGVGVLQIPPEQRENMQHKAFEACRGAQDHALNLTEVISNSCANTYSDSGIADHVPLEMKQCCEAIDEEVTKVVQANTKAPDDDFLDDDETGLVMDGAGNKSRNVKGGTIGGDGSGIGGNKKVDGGGNKIGDSKSSLSPTRFRNKKEKVACLRDGPIIPVCQIHALDPGAQPRAWLDVLANAESSHDEKLEAMEEISILAKDKVRTRIFLEEGVLDSLLWIIGRYFEKLEYDQDIHQWANPTITRQEAESARLAATCCLTLGKSHCASVHTGGDLLLMSLYERGTVPEERQLAQMFHEVPFHSRLIKPNDDPTIIDPGNEMFAMKQLSLPQAEELAKKIAAVACGDIRYDA